MKPTITFIIPVADEEVFRKCLQSSPLFADSHTFQILSQVGRRCSGEAFNQGIDQAQADRLVFCHQDIMFPFGWADQFQARLDELERTATNIGVVGCAGKTASLEVAGHLYRHDRELNGSVPLPAVVRTLDECIVSFRKSSGLRFDEQLPSFFFYGTDICMLAESRGFVNYALDAPCFHQAKDRRHIAPAALFDAEKYVLRKWRERLPIQTLSGTMKGEAYLAVKRARSWVRAWLARAGYQSPAWWAHLPRISPQPILAGRMESKPARFNSPSEAKASN